MQQSATISFDSFSSYKRSCEKESPGLVKTNSGHIHFIERRVALGVLKEDELNSATLKDIRKPKLLKSPRRAKSEGNLSVNKVGEYLGFVNKAPALGEQRPVILDMQWTRFGFQLKSYGRMSKRGKQQQSIVQHVTIGSPAFMAGLHQGDAIIEINGEDVRCASPDEIVDKIMNTKEARVHLIVEFVDGVRRNDLRRKQTELKQRMSVKQEELKKLLSSKQCLTSHQGVVRQPSNNVITTVGLPTTASICDSSQDKNGTESNESIVTASTRDKKLALYTGDVLSLTADILVVPLGDPVFEYSDEETTSERIMTKLLHAGGDKLINELSLSVYCELGEVINTSGGKLKGIRNIHHCVFGSTDDHIVKCFTTSLAKAVEQKAASIAFWVDGFFAANVSPFKVLEMMSAVIQNIADSDLVIVVVSSTIADLENVVKDIFCHN